MELKSYLLYQQNLWYHQDKILLLSWIDLTDNELSYNLLKSFKGNLVISVGNYRPINSKQYLDELFYKKTINTSYNKNNFVKKGFRSSNLKTSILASGGELPSDLEALILSGVFLFPELIAKFFEKLELADFKNSKLKEIRDNLLMLEKKDDGDLGIDLLKDYIKNNYKGFSDDNLKFANRFWLNQKNKDFREISKVWLEILSDDQHIKSLERDIQDNKSKISNEDDERRFIELIKDRDNSIKSIEEKYGKEESQ